MGLDVHLHGGRIGTLFQAAEDDCRFAYAPGIVEEVGAGVSLLSTALPARSEPFSAEATGAYIGSLLPEGVRRERISSDLGVDPDDDYALLAEIGRDCAGAVSFVPEGGDASSDSDEVHWLSEEELDGLLCRQFGRRPSPGDPSPPTMRATLAGQRPKLALVRDEPSGRWGLPSAGVPSTHIVKPETGEFPNLVANELFCMAVARLTGLPVAETEHAAIAGRSCVVSRRFDRAGSGTNATRIHQEDFCQALGFPPLPSGALPAAIGEEGEGNDDADGPGFAESCGLLKAVGRGDDVPLLLTAAICNYSLGNGDAHGKNFALLYDGDGPSLAPFYDLTSTAAYDLPVHTGMVLVDEYDDTAYLIDLGRVCEESGFDLDPFRDLIVLTAAPIADCLEEVADQARAEGWHAPVVDDIVELAGERARCLTYEVEY